MHRFCIILAVLTMITTTTFARTVHKSQSESSSDSNEGGCNDQNNAPEVNVERTTTGLETTTPFPTMVDGSDNVDDDMVTTLANMATTRPSTTTIKAAFRKRRAAKAFEAAKSKSVSASEEIQGNGNENDTDKPALDPVISSEKLFNISDTEGSGSTDESSTLTAALGSLDSPSNEIGSGDGDHSVEGTSNEVLESKVGEAKIDLLKKKLQNWQNSVDSYLNNKGQQRRRRREQSTWSHLYPSANGVASNIYPSSSKASNSLLSAAGDAMSDALKPAMGLMTQGVSLLSDLYASHLSNSYPSRYISARSASGNDTDSAADDQFREQLKTLQMKLGDLGEQLQRVVNSFQRMQVPFLDNIMTAGMLPFAGSATKIDTDKDNTLYGKSIDNKLV